ncbi:hypothetical protein KM043_002764 [Ampulex compressa]|nr:hypothetical protein KM043_002764 [Ampulex compressa]
MGATGRTTGDASGADVTEWRPQETRGDLAELGRVAGARDFVEICGETFQRGRTIWIAMARGVEVSLGTSSDGERRGAERLDDAAKEDTCVVTKIEARAYSGGVPTIQDTFHDKNHIRNRRKERRSPQELARFSKNTHHGKKKKKKIVNNSNLRARLVKTTLESLRNGQAGGRCGPKRVSGPPDSSPRGGRSPMAARKGAPTRERERRKRPRGREEISLARGTARNTIHVAPTSRLASRPPWTIDVRFAWERRAGPRRASARAPPAPRKSRLPPLEAREFWERQFRAGAPPPSYATAATAQCGSSSG